MRLSQVNLELGELDRMIGESKRKAREAEGQASGQPAPSQSPAGYQTRFSGFGGMRSEGGDEQFITPGGDLYQGSESTAPAQALVPSAAEIAGYQGQDYLTMDPARVAAFKADLAERARLFEAQTGESSQGVGPTYTPGQRSFGAARGAMDSLQATREKMAQEDVIQRTPSLFKAEQAEKEREAAVQAAYGERLFKTEQSRLDREGRVSVAEVGAQAKNDAAFTKASSDLAMNSDYSPEEKAKILPVLASIFQNRGGAGGVGGVAGGPSPETGAGAGDQDPELQALLAEGATIIGKKADGSTVLRMPDGEEVVYEPGDGSEDQTALAPSQLGPQEIGVQEPRDLATLIRQSQMNNPRLAKNREIAAQERLGLSRESKRNRERQELPRMYQEAINAQRLADLKKELRLFGG
jgi:hypothetical protein